MSITSDAGGRLVSVITPTWQRHELLLGVIDNVRRQTYRPLEHVIVSDGLHEATRLMVDDQREAMAMYQREQARLADGNPPVPIQFVELGRNWSTLLVDSYAAAPMQVGMFIASGDYQMWLSDDERMEPDHIESLVAALEAADADFAYSRARMYHVGQAPEQGYDIGSDPPSRGQITNVLYRADLLKRGLYVFGDDRASDWATIATWMAAGTTWAYVDRVTLTHRADR